MQQTPSVTGEEKTARGVRWQTLPQQDLLHPLHGKGNPATRSDMKLFRAAPRPTSRPRELQDRGQNQKKDTE